MEIRAAGARRVVILCANHASGVGLAPGRCLDDLHAGGVERTGVRRDGVLQEGADVPGAREPFPQNQERWTPGGDAVCASRKGKAVYAGADNRSLRDERVLP